MKSKIKKLIMIVVVLAMVVGCFQMVPAIAYDYEVSTWEDLQKQMKIAMDGDTILINGSISVPSGVTWGSDSKSLTLKRMSESGRLTFLNDSDAVSTIKNITFDGGGVSGGSFVRITKNMVFQGCTFKNHKINGNGSIQVTNGTIEFDNCLFQDNHASASAHIYAKGSTISLVLDNCTMTGGYVDSGNGGAIFCTGSCMIKNSTITGNYAEFYGGALYGSGSFICMNSNIYGNTARSGGSDIYVLNIDMETELADLQDIYDGTNINPLGWEPQKTAQTEGAYMSLRMDYEEIPEDDPPQEDPSEDTPSDPVEEPEDPPQENPSDPEEPIDNPQEEPHEDPQDEPQDPPEDQPQDEPSDPVVDPVNDPEDTPSEPINEPQNNPSDEGDNSGQQGTETTSDKGSEGSGTDSKQVVNNYYYYSDTTRYIYQTEDPKKEEKATETAIVKDQEEKDPEPKQEQKTEDEKSSVDQKESSEESEKNTSDLVQKIIIKEVQADQSKNDYQDDLKDGEQKEESVSEPIVLNLEGLSCSIQEGVDCTIQIKGGKYSVSFSNMDESDQTETHPDWFEYAEMGVIMALGIGFIISMGKISRLKKKSVKNDSGRFDE